MFWCFFMSFCCWSPCIKHYEILRLKSVFFTKSVLILTKQNVFTVSSSAKQRRHCELWALYSYKKKKKKRKRKPEHQSLGSTWKQGRWSTDADFICSFQELCSLLIRSEINQAVGKSAARSSYRQPSLHADLRSTFQTLNICLKSTASKSCVQICSSGWRRSRRKLKNDWDFKWCW